MYDYKKLQNGSDVRGVALDGVPGETVTLTPQVACDISAAFGRWLAARKSKPTRELRVAVGRDSRDSGPVLVGGITSGLTAMGIQVGDCGLCSTPAIFMSTVLPGFEFDGGIMVTASHLPANRNGLKFFTRDGGLEHEDVAHILADCTPASAHLDNLKVTDCALQDAYAHYLRKVIRKGINSQTNFRKPLLGFKIAVDAGNGAGGFFAKLVLEPLGADCSASVFLDPDGSFPNHIPNPENKAAMESICKAVRGGGCDLGIIFDTDVDRAGAVDSQGNEISRNRLIALMASIVSENEPGAIIVTDSVTSSQLANFINKELGCVHLRYKRGYKNVINEAIRLNHGGKNCPLAIETSGHGALRENYFLDDGAYLSAKIVIKLAQLRERGGSLSALLDRLQEPLEAIEYRLKISCDDFKEYGATVLDDLARYAVQRPEWQLATDNHEGLRANVPAADGWFLLRLSLHDPQMPLNIESNKPGGVAEITASLQEFLSSYDKLHLPLEL